MEPDQELASYPSPHLAVDLVLLTVLEDCLNLLLVERQQEPFKGQWVLPGGFVHPNENLDDTARRVLEAKANLAGLAVEQLFTFSEPGRDPRGWVVSTGYFALVPFKRLEQAAAAREDLILAEIGLDAADRLSMHCQGESIEPGFDHAEIIRTTITRLRGKLDWTNIAFGLLPQRFTLMELQQVHELILGRPLLKPVFRRKMLDREFTGGLHLTPTGEFTRGQRHRPAELYELTRNDEK